MYLLINIFDFRNMIYLEKLYYSIIFIIVIFKDIYRYVFYEKRKLNFFLNINIKLNCYVLKE